MRDYLAKQKMRDTLLQEKTEKDFIKRFADRQEKAKQMFEEEVLSVKVQYRRLKTEQTHIMSIVNKWQMMSASAERQLGMVRVALKRSDFKGIYEAMDEAFPKRMQVAVYLIQQFEHNDFKFATLS